MPDLTTEYRQRCNHNAYTESVPSSSGNGTYDVHVWKNSEGEVFGRCDCKGFEFRGTCKHVNELKTKLCDWDQETGPEAQTPHQEMECLCPRCGSETLVYAVAV